MRDRGDRAQFLADEIAALWFAEVEQILHIGVEQRAELRAGESLDRGVIIVFALEAELGDDIEAGIGGRMAERRGAGLDIAAAVERDAGDLLDRERRVDVLVIID